MYNEYEQAPSDGEVQFLQEQEAINNAWQEDELIKEILSTKIF